MRTWDMGWSLDIQVGSRICLSVCLHRIIAYELRWGVTHLGCFHYWALAHPVEGIYYFRYRERTRRRLILEAYFEESRVVALMVL